MISHGRAEVVVAAADYDRLAGPSGDLASFMRSSPLAAALAEEDDFGRVRGRVRDLHPWAG